MAKIQMTTPLVEMDGDEMTRIIWQMIKDELLCPFVDLKTEYYDLGLEHRDATDDQVTVDSAEATKKSTALPSSAPPSRRMPPASRNTISKQMWKSPNGTIRAMLDGTVFRAPIVVKGIEPCVQQLGKAHHHRAPCIRRRVQERRDARFPAAGKVELVYTAEDGSETA